MSIQTQSIIAGLELKIKEAKSSNFNGFVTVDTPIDILDLEELLEAFKKLASQKFEWIPIDKDNLPEGEVLAACFDKTKDAYKRKVIGEIEIWERRICCRGDMPYLINCTHYIDINKYDI